MKWKEGVGFYEKTMMYCVIILVVLTTKGIAENILCVSNNSMNIGEKNEKFYNDIYTIDDKVYVPVRELSEKLGIPILWDDAQEQVTLMTPESYKFKH